MRRVLWSDLVNRNKVVIPFVTLEQRDTNLRIADFWLAWGVSKRFDVDPETTVVFVVADRRRVPNIWISRK